MNLSTLLEFLVSSHLVQSILQTTDRCRTDITFLLVLTACLPHATPVSSDTFVPTQVLMHLKIGVHLEN